MVVAAEFAMGQIYEERRVDDLMLTRKLLMASRREGMMYRVEPLNTKPNTRSSGERVRVSALQAGYWRWLG